MRASKSCWRSEQVAPVPNFVPIAQAGLPFEFTSGTATLVGSTATATDANNVQFTLAFNPAPDPVPTVRITVQSYQAGSEFGDVSGAKFTLGDGGPGVDYVNTSPAANPQTAFVPSQITGPATNIAYQSANGGEWTSDETFAFLIEVDAAETCQELGRQTRAFVSGYNRSRVHQSRLYPREKRCLVADFNGALPTGRTIVSATWNMEVPYCVGMSSATIADREARVMVEAVFRGWANMRCQVTLDNGEVYNQLFVVQVLAGPWFGDEITVAGPSQITVTT